MRFKDDLRADLRDVFFNFDELAKLHWLNGVLLAGTERRCTERLSERRSEDYDALHGESVTLMFRAEDFLRKSARLPKEKERVKYDGAWYDVKHASSEYGCCRLEMESQRGRYA